MRAEELFTGEARARIERAVQDAERSTSGEIVPMVVDRSHDYAGVRAAAAALCAFAGGVVVLAAPLDPLLWLPPVQLVVFVGAWLLSDRRALLRLILPTGRCAEMVDRAAGLAFLEEGLTETRDRTGILIYVSLLEHRVEVLADRGINSVVEPGTWDGVVDTVLAGIRERRAEEGLADAIAQCGELLAQRFPPRADDTDELANRLRGN